jgi:hypothetical protein
MASPRLAIRRLRSFMGVEVLFRFSGLVGSDDDGTLERRA